MAALDKPLNVGEYRSPDFAPEVAELNDRERALRDLFVAEYLTDFDQVRAAQRCGFSLQFAIEYARNFMEEPYVQRKLAEVTMRRTEAKATDEYNRQRIQARLMEEAHYKGPGSSHSARVAALAKLAALYNMEPAKNVNVTATHKGGVMAVPGIADISDWEKTAAASQDKLAEHARS